ncbi:MAG: type II toxin-antitoxin system RelE family toxin [Gammaproteobacteria bacterium]
MAGYRLLIKPSAVKEIDAIGAKRDRQRIIARIAELAGTPRPRGCEKLAGSEGRLRIRQGNYRVVCAVDDAGWVVEVVKVGHRREVYRKGA